MDQKVANKLLPFLMVAEGGDPETDPPPGQVIVTHLLIMMIMVGMDASWAEAGNAEVIEYAVDLLCALLLNGH
jgi:hypothetical protein